MTRRTTRFKGPALPGPTSPPNSPQEPSIVRTSGVKSIISGVSKPLVQGLAPETLPAPQFHSQRSGPFHCKVYIEWGGQYDVRELALVFWQGKFSYEDLTGGHITLHNHLTDQHSSEQQAAVELIEFVFKLGESRSFIDFGKGGVVYKNSKEALKK